MTLAPFVRILGRGPGRSRSLSHDEAVAAMEVILAGQADPEAVGALLMLLRMKGETAEEIAGFATAAQGVLPQMPKVDLDWPSYAAGRTRGLPWFLLAAKLIAQSGGRVLLHGWNGAAADIRAGLEELEIPEAHTIADLGADLTRENIGYIPLEIMSPHVFRLLQLRDVLGLRSCINTVARMMNPGRAAAGVQGVFHPPYRLLQADAAQMLGWQNLSVIKGGGGEFERHPGKSVAVFGLRDNTLWQDTVPAVSDDTRRLIDGPKGAGVLRDIWDGRSHDDFAVSVVLATTALALDTLQVENAEAVAQELWANRSAPLGNTVANTRAPCATC